MMRHILFNILGSIIMGNLLTVLMLKFKVKQARSKAKTTGGAEQKMVKQNYSSPPPPPGPVTQKTDRLNSFKMQWQRTSKKQ